MILTGLVLATALLQVDPAPAAAPETATPPAQAEPDTAPDRAAPTPAAQAAPEEPVLAPAPASTAEAPPTPSAPPPPRPAPQAATPPALPAPPVTAAPAPRPAGSGLPLAPAPLPVPPPAPLPAPAASPVATPAPAPAGTERDQAERSARAFLVALAAGDAEGLTAASSERFSFDGDARTGRDAVRANWRAVLADRRPASPDRLDALEVLPAAEAVARLGPPPARVAPLATRGWIAIAEVSGRPVVLFLAREGGRMSVVGMHD